MNKSYSKPLIRFWWIILLGALIAGLASIAVIDRELNQRTFTATARLLVTSAEAPFYRISTTKLIEDPGTEVQTTDSGEAAAGESRTGTQEAATADQTRPILFTNTPDTRALIQAANLYPLLIESDQVAAIRADMFGELPGDIFARAIYAVSTPGRFELSDVPVIELTAQAGRPGEAIRLAQATSVAFISWISDQQKGAELDQSERIVIQPLKDPREATPSGSAPVALAGVVLLAVWAAFFALAIALDRLFPRRRKAEVPEAAKRPVVERVDQPVEATKP